MMHDRFILIKSKENILSPYLIDFLKGFLGYDIEINQTNDIISILYKLDDEELVYAGLSSLVAELDTNINVFISKKNIKSLHDSIEIIKKYLKEEIFKNSIYREDEFILELILKGKKEDLDKVVFKDREIDSSMLECIKVFIETDMNTSKASELLFLHRNTLINKIDKFINITGYNVKKFKNAMIIYYLLNK